MSVPSEFPDSPAMTDATSISRPLCARPQRLRIQDELGRTRTLEPARFLTLTGGSLPQGTSTPTSAQSLLLFGLGPEPEKLADAIASAFGSGVSLNVFWIECPDFEAQMPADWKIRIPAHWRPLSGTDAAVELARSLPSSNLWRYAPGAQLFSTFWGPLLGTVQAQILGCTPARTVSQTVLLPGSTGDLLTFELEQAVRNVGCTPLSIATDPASLIRFLHDERPALLLSVNMRGLDIHGECFRLLQAAGVPVALWFVDNPWHILSSLRTPWWREAALFVTDASFITPLKKQGAAFVRHLPLGAWMSTSETTSDQAALNPLVFVGRSVFPDHDRFFAGCHLPQPLLDEALHMNTAPPHVHWWEHRLALKNLWPGTEARQAGYGAEHCSSQRRTHWLRVAAPLGLTVFGDAAWKQLLPSDCDIRPPLDYYTALAPVYRAARYNLNVTSLLLPEGLTQRHFDVWTAGGFLLSDPTPGLKGFPSQLVEHMIVLSPEELPSRINYLERDSLLRQHLIQEWKEYLNRFHTYTVRFVTLLRELSITTANDSVMDSVFPQV